VSSARVAIATLAIFAAAAAATLAETPKSGGTLTYMIPAEIIRMHLSNSQSPQVNFAASGGGPSKAGSRRRNSISSASASAAKSLRADSDVSAPSRKSAPVR
jgi:hypothetical protein